jgi:hypothetical protein
MDDGSYHYEEDAPKILATFNAYDQADVEMYSHASGYYSVIAYTLQYLREKIKYGHDYKDADAALEDIRVFINGQCSDYHLPND